MARAWVTAYVDVICSHTWSVRRHLERLQAEYGDRLTWQWVLYPLMRNPSSFRDPYHAMGRPQQVGPHWAEVSEYLGEPIAHTLWRDDPVLDTFPAALACAAAGRQDPAAVGRLFAALSRAAIGQKRNVGRPEVIQAVAAEVGLDPQRLAADMVDPGLVQGVEAAIAAAREKGVRTRPTLVFRNAQGEEYWIIGPRPWEDYAAAVQAVTSGRPLGGQVRVGGRILGYTDLVVGPLPAGWAPGQAPPAAVEGDLWLAPLAWGDGTPAWAAARFFALGVSPASRASAAAPLTAPAALAHLLRDLHRQGLALAALRGRLEGQPVQWLGVRAVAPSAEEARAAAAAGAAALAGALAAAGLAPAPVPGPALAAAQRLLASAPATCALRNVPRVWLEGPPPLGDLAGALPGDALLLVLAGPVPDGELAAALDRLHASRARLQALRQDPAAAAELGPALADSLWVRTGQLSRLTAARTGGAWAVSAVCHGQGDPAHLATLLEERLHDPHAVYPLHAYAAGEGDWVHLRHHAFALTPCAERHFTGALRWGNWLTGAELASYLA